MSNSTESTSQTFYSNLKETFKKDIKEDVEDIISAHHTAIKNLTEELESELQITDPEKRKILVDSKRSASDTILKLSENALKILDTYIDAEKEEGKKEEKPEEKEEKPEAVQITPRIGSRIGHK